MINRALYAAAKKAQKNSHAPYSRHEVGCAVLTKNKKIFSGANVENAAYPTGICAETSAIAAAVSAGEREIKSICIVSNRRNPSSPCGQCRQFISEFANADTEVEIVGSKGSSKSFLFWELLPHSFSSKNLRSKK